MSPTQRQITSSQRIEKDRGSYLKCVNKVKETIVVL